MQFIDKQRRALLQGAAALQRFECRPGEPVQRGLVDAQQAAQFLRAGIGLQAQRPGLDQPVLLQQGAGGGGVLAVGLELLEELQHLGGGRGELALLVEEGLAVAGAHEPAIGVDAQHLLAVLGAGQAEGVAAVGRRDVAGQPAAVRRHIQVAAGLQALDGDGQELLLLGDEAYGQGHGGLGQLLQHQGAEVVVAGKAVVGRAAPAQLAVLLERQRRPLAGGRVGGGGIGHVVWLWECAAQHNAARAAPGIVRMAHGAWRMARGAVLLPPPVGEGGGGGRHGLFFHALRTRQRAPIPTFPQRGKE